MPASLTSKSKPYLKVAWVAGSLLLIGCSAYLTLQSQMTLGRSIGDVTRGFEAQQRLQTAYEGVLDAETGQRGFLLTLREAYLTPYMRAIENLPDEMARVRTLMVDTPAQLMRLDALQSLMREKLDELGQTIRLAKAGDPAGALELVKTDRGRNTMIKIRGLVGQIAGENSRILASRQVEYAAQSQRDTRLAATLVALNGLFAVVLATLLWRLNKVESLVTICAWSNAIEYQGEWMSFETYLARRFNITTSHGMSPDETQKFQARLEKSGSDRP